MLEPPAISPPESKALVSDSPPRFWHALGAITLWAAIACLLTLVNRYVSHVIPIPTPGGFAGNLLAILYLLIFLAVLLQVGRAAARLPISAASQAIIGGILALPALIRLGLFALAALRPQFTSLTQQFDLQSAFLPPGVQEILNNFLAPIGLSMLGSAVGRIIKHPNTLLAAAAFAAFFDVVVVTMGPVAQILQSGSNLISSVSIGSGGASAASVLPQTGRYFPPLSSVTIGPADVLFIGLFLSAVYHLNLSKRATLLWMFGLGGLALILVQCFPNLPIPALVPFGIAVLIANLSHAAFTKQEKRDLKIGAAFAIFCAILIVVGARTFLASPPPPPSLGLQIGRMQGPQGQPGPLVITGIKNQSPAETAGLKPGDAVLAVNGSPATDAQFETGRSEIRKRGGMTLTVQSRGEAKSRLVEVKVPEETPK